MFTCKSLPYMLNYLVQSLSCPAVIVVLSNAEDTSAILHEAVRQRLMNGEYLFLLVQQFEVSGNVVSNLHERDAGN